MLKFAKHTPKQMEQPIKLERPFFDNVEELFSEFIEFCGGQIVDKLDTNLTDRLNADYIFEKPKTIAELKTFKKDVFSEPEDLLRWELLYKKWLDNKIISQKEFRDIAFKGKKLPQKCINDLIKSASKTVERAMSKGNKQIEETKKTFNYTDAFGILFLINDGNYFFTNEGLLSIICQIMKRKFTISSFDVIVYLTINQVTRKIGSELDHSVWIPIYTKIDDKGETIVTDEFHGFINDLGKKFKVDFMTYKTGHKPIEHTQIENLDETIIELNKHKFIPKDIIFKK